MSTPALGSPSLLFNGYLGSFPGIKRPERETNHSPSSSAEVKNGWIYTSAPPICLHVPLALMYTPGFQAVQFLIPRWSYHSFQTERHGRVERMPASYPMGPGLSSGTRRNSSTTFSFRILSNSLFTNHHNTRRYPVSATDGWLCQVHGDIGIVG